MAQKKQEFKVAAFGAKFDATCAILTKLLAEGNTQELTALCKQLHQDLKKYRDDGLLKVAFVGAYNAGKSTEIAALTGLRDDGTPNSLIKIGSDVTTGKCTEYDWNGIKIIDTPGLWTGRQDHDEITYDAIKKADLLVFCLTHNLFDDFTVTNFKKLAYEEKYAWKMMLIVNKMSEEAGEEAEKIANYRQSLTAALEPSSLDEFPICFIDAKDYYEGIDAKDFFLIEVSRFQTFIDELNVFVNARGDKAKFDTPVRIALGCVNDAQLSYIRNLNSAQDEAFLELFRRLSRTVEKERYRLRTKIQKIAQEQSAQIIQQGIYLSQGVGTDNFISLEKQAISNIKKCYEQAQFQVQEEFDDTIKSLKEQLENELKSDLYRTIEASVVSKTSLSVPVVNPKSNLLAAVEGITVTCAFSAGQILRDKAINEATKNTMIETNEAVKKAHQSLEQAQKTGNIAEINAATKTLESETVKQKEVYKFWLDDSQVVGSELRG